MKPIIAITWIFLIFSSLCTSVGAQNTAEQGTYSMYVKFDDEAFSKLFESDQKKALSWISNQIYKHAYPISIKGSQFPFPRQRHLNGDELGLFRVMRLELGMRAADTAGFRKGLEELPEVSYAEYLIHPLIDYYPNDLSINTVGQSWHLYATNTIQAWNYEQGDSNIVVAIVDDANELGHADLVNKYIKNEVEIPGDNIDNDNNGYIDDYIGFDVAGLDPDVSPDYFNMDHGTRVGGVAGAETDNNNGVASVGFNISLLPVKSSNTNAVISHAYEGIYYAAVRQADIINCSWSSSSYGATDLSVIQFANAQGSVVVASAGNHSVQLVRYPAGFSSVVGVMATDYYGKLASFSNYGNFFNICAPGEYMITTDLNDKYFSFSGTSSAAPFVSGALGLMKSHYPIATRQQLLGCLYYSADNIDADNPLYAGKLANGEINVLRSMQCMDSMATSTPITQVSYRERTYCTNEPLSFKASSYFPYDSIIWSAPNGLVQGQGTTEPRIVFPNSGTYYVQCKMHNKNGWDSTRVYGIEITGQFSQDAYYYDFEQGLTSSGWTSQSAIGAFNWKDFQFVDSSIAGSKDTLRGIVVQAYQVFSTGNRSELTSPLLHFESFGEMKMEMRFAYAPNTKSSKDSIRIEFSNDSGQHFQLLTSFSLPEALATAPETGTSFLANKANYWCDISGNCLTIDLRELNRVASGKVRIVHVSHLYGQNLFIDHIRFTGACIGDFSDPPIAGLEAEDPVLCEPGYVQFRDTSVNYPYSWYWEFPGGVPASSTLSSPKVHYQTNGVYPVRLVVSNPFGTDTFQWLDSIRLLKKAVFTPNFTDSSICPNTPILLKLDGAEKVYWTPSSDLDTNMGNPVMLLTDKGGMIKAIGEDPWGCRDSVTYFYTVLAAPQQPKIFKSGNAYTLFPVEDSLSYQWYLNWQPIAGATDSIWIPVQSGRYSAEVRHKRTGCLDTTRFSVDYIHTGIQGQDDWKIVVYPNPGRGVFRIDLPFQDSWSFTVFNALGQPVWQGSAQGEFETLDLEHLADGVYYLKVQNVSSGRIEVLRLNLHH